MPMEAEAIEVRKLAAAVFFCLQDCFAYPGPACLQHMFREAFLTGREAGWDLRLSSLRTQQGSDRRRQLGHGLCF